MNEIIRKIDEEIENANQRIKQSPNLEERHGYCKYQDGLQKAKEWFNRPAYYVEREKQCL